MISEIKVREFKKIPIKVYEEIKFVTGTTLLEKAYDGKGHDSIEWIDTRGINIPYYVYYI